jgi:hypothetical protein
MVASSAMVVLLQLSLQTAKQICMNTGIDFLAENLLGTLDGQRRHLLTQGFAGFDGLLLGFNLGGSNDLVAFFVAFALASSMMACARRSASARRPPSRCATWPIRLLPACWRKKVRTWLCRQQRGHRRFSGTFIQCSRDGRPHELHREPHQQCEDDSLRYQCSINAHS